MPSDSQRPLSRRVAPLRERRPAAFVATLDAALTALAGIVNVVSALTPELAERLRDIHALAPATEIMIANRLALPIGIALLLAAPYLALRRRGALWAAVLLLATIGAVDLFKGLDWEEALVSWAAAAALVRWRAAFWVRHDPGHARAAAGDIGLVAGAALVAGGVLALLGVSWGIEEVLAVAPFTLALAMAFRRPSLPATEGCREDVAA